MSTILKMMDTTRPPGAGLGAGLDAGLALLAAAAPPSAVAVAAGVGTGVGTVVALRFCGGMFDSRRASSSCSCEMLTAK